MCRASQRRLDTWRHPLALSDEALVAAAWLHDIGYAPEVTDTGFHPLDGARYLVGLGIAERVVNLWAATLTRSWKPSFADSDPG